MNHETVIESLAEALEEMTDLVKDAERDWMLVSSDEMTSRVVDLYTGIFQFLNHAMEWMMRSRSKRAADAFNENLANIFQNDISGVKSKFERIRLFATQSGLADGRITRHRVEGISSGVDGLREDNVRMEHMIKEMKESYKQLAQLCQQQLLIPQAQAFINDRRLLVEAKERRLSWQSTASSIFSVEDSESLEPHSFIRKVLTIQQSQKRNPVTSQNPST